jgi:hypothetical protein
MATAPLIQINPGVPLQGRHIMRFLPVAVLAVALMIGPADADVLYPRESAAFIDGNLLRDMCADPGTSHARPWSRCVAELASAALTRWFSIGRQASGRGLQGCPSVRRSCRTRPLTRGFLPSNPCPLRCDRA